MRRLPLMSDDDLPPDDMGHLPPPSDLPPEPGTDAKAQRNREKAAEKLRQREEKAAKVAAKKKKQGQQGRGLGTEAEALPHDLPPDDDLPPLDNLPAHDDLDALRCI